MQDLADRSQNAGGRLGRGGTMQEPGFQITLVADRRTIEARLTGFWTPAILAAYSRDLERVASALNERKQAFALLCDSRSFLVQSPEVADGFARLARDAVRYHEGYTAVVVGSVLAKMQAERAMPDPKLRVFLDLEAARAWIADRLGRTPSSGT